MTNMRSYLTASVTGLIVAALALATAPSVARAQTQWNGYAPVYAAPPAVTYYAPSYAAPRYYAPAPSSPANPRAWQGYAPSTSWRYYDPAVGWRAYTPGVVIAAPSVPTGAPLTSLTPNSTSNPEYGTGRTNHMIKPWLPPAPH
jgi:hypothetical protein